MRGERDAAARDLVLGIPVVRAVDVGDARALAGSLGLLVGIPRVDDVGVLLVRGTARVRLLVGVRAVAVAHSRVRVIVAQRLVLRREESGWDERGRRDGRQLFRDARRSPQMGDRELFQKGVGAGGVA